MSANLAHRSCQTEQIAAYLDGELDDNALSLLELHLAQCSLCRASLNEQRQLLCMLESSLSRNTTLSLPRNFARTVAVHAESDMRGVRNAREHGRALRMCVLLALASFALLGAASSDAVFNVSGLLVRRVAAVLDLVWTIAYDAVAGLALITRVVARSLFPESYLTACFGLLALAVAVVLLSRLIAKYHRARLVD